MTNPSWRTAKISSASVLRSNIDSKSSQVREMEIEIANLKEALARIEQSELPILLYVCKYKDDDTGRLDYDHLYYLPDLGMPKLDRATRYLNCPDENLLRPLTLDLRKCFRNCNFPKEIVSTTPDFWKLKQKNQVAVEKAVKDLESVIDSFFDSGKIDSWAQLRDCLKKHYLSKKTGTSKRRK